MDIPINADLSGLIKLPPCDALRLPGPQKLKVTLPSGGSLSAISDMSKGIPTDCSLVFNLLIRLGPMLASMECLFRVLKLLEPLMDVINGLTKVPPKPPISALKKMAKAAKELSECFLTLVPGGPMLLFVRDILCLILKVLRCVIGQLKGVAKVMSGLTLRLQIAEKAGNTELSRMLNCSLENNILSAQHLFSSLEPVFTLLDLVKPFMSIAGVPPIELPSVGSPGDASALLETVKTLEGVATVLQTVVDGLGGCPS